MTDIDSYIQRSFAASIEIKTLSAGMIGESIELASTLLNKALLSGHKILICGNAADSQHFAASLLNRYERDRPGLAAIALTTDSSTLMAIANDRNYKEVFARQVTTLGQPGDLLLVLSTSGQSSSINQAIIAANENEMPVIALTGRDGGIIAQLMDENSIEIRVPSNVTARIQEVHRLVLNILCELVDLQLLGPPD